MRTLANTPTEIKARELYGTNIAPRPIRDITRDETLGLQSDDGVVRDESIVPPDDVGHVGDTSVPSFRAAHRSVQRGSSGLLSRMRKKRQERMSEDPDFDDDEPPF